jgi:hypothetical protein
METKEFKFEADISLEEWQIEDLERQIQEETEKRYGENCQIKDYGFSINVVVKVLTEKKKRSKSNKRSLISKIAKAHGVSEEYVANNFREFAQEM